MSDSPPPSNSSRPPTPTLLPLTGLRQLSEVSEPDPAREPERESRVTITVPVDAPTSSGEPDGNENENKKISPCKRCYLQFRSNKTMTPFFFIKKNIQLPPSLPSSLKNLS